MVAGCRVTEEILGKVAYIYTWLDEQIRDNEKLSGRCNVCGKCCDFEEFDHRLFVTPPELMYLATNIGAENIKSMQGGCCPYQANGKCSIYKYRFDFITPCSVGTKLKGLRRDHKWAERRKHHATL